MNFINIRDNEKSNNFNKTRRHSGGILKYGENVSLKRDVWRQALWHNQSPGTKKGTIRKARNENP